MSSVFRSVGIPDEYRLRETDVDASPGSVDWYASLANSHIRRGDLNGLERTCELLRSEFAPPRPLNFYTVLDGKGAGPHGSLEVCEVLLLLTVCEAKLGAMEAASKSGQRALAISDHILEFCRMTVKSKMGSEKAFLRTLARGMRRIEPAFYERVLHVNCRAREMLV